MLFVFLSFPTEHYVNTFIWLTFAVIDQPARSECFSLHNDLTGETISKSAATNLPTVNLAVLGF